MENKDFSIKELEDYMKTVFEQKLKNLPKSCGESKLLITDKDGLFYGTTRNTGLNLTTGLGGILQMPRTFSKIYYNGVEVIKHEEFWKILEEL